jgi:hypothetical protein
MSIRVKNYQDFVLLILALPEGVFYAVDSPICIRVQAEGERVKQVRSAFPGQIWKKVKKESCGWWEYITTLPTGITIEIYADRVGPKSCVRVERTITTQEEVEVPVVTRKEMQEVTRTVVSWECPDAKEGE